jgi:hypothetical protein
MSIAESRARLAAVLRKSGDFITVADARQALAVNPVAAAKVLVRWNQQG